jgi:hypothetical protein
VSALEVVKATSLAGAAADDLALLERQRDRLLARLAVQRRHSLDLWGWYHGLQPDPAVAGRYRDQYRLLLGIARTPWARLVVDTIAERLHVQGFRSGTMPVGDAVGEEQAAWQVYEGSSMDADEWLVYTEALITGVGYVSCAVEDGTPRLAAESGLEMTHEPTPGNRRQVGAALKMYPLDWDGPWSVELYRREATYRWLYADTSGRRVDPDAHPLDTAWRPETITWEESEPFTVTNPLGEVTIVPFENRATVLGGGVSELEDCIPILRRIDKLTLDKLMTSEFASFKQKWATGLEVPVDPETGKRVEPFKAAVDKLWINTSAEGRFGTFDASDLAPYLSAIDAEISALAAISRVPAHYLVQSSLANPPSAESLIAAESGLVAKVRERQRRFGEAWERALRLALELAGADGAQLEVVWADAEMRNPAQVADAAVKLQSIGVPQRALWQYVGATPQQVDAWTLEQASAQLAALANVPPG